MFIIQTGATERIMNDTKVSVFHLRQTHENKESLQINCLKYRNIKCLSYEKMLILERTD